MTIPALLCLIVVLSLAAIIGLTEKAIRNSGLKTAVSMVSRNGA